jgi:hypothetical protein
MIDKLHRNKYMRNMSVLICSSDKYKSLWNLHFDFLNRYWSDCPYPVYLGTDSLKFEKINTLLTTGNRLSWSSCLLEWLNQIETEYVLLTLEDFIIRRQIITSEINHCLEFIVNQNIDCLRLVARPLPFYRDNENKLFGSYDKRMPYIVSLQASIWKKTTLMSLIVEGESIWEFEIYGSFRAKLQEKLRFYGVYRTIFDYGEHIIDGGKMLRSSTYNLPVKKYNLDFDYNLIQIELIILLKRLLHFFIHRQPASLRVKSINLVNYIFKSHTVHQKTIAANESK